MEKIKEKKTIASITKAIKVIEFIAENKEAGATEVSTGLGYGVSGTYHILNTLKESNLIIQDKNSKKFKLGLKLWKLGSMAYEQNHLADVVKPYLKKLRDVSGETANLTIMDNNKIVYIAQEESGRLVRMFTKIGATAPLHCTGGGKTILAHKPNEIRNDIIDRIDLEPFTDSTITDKTDFIEEMDRIREYGYGFDNEEREEGVSCIAAPIFDVSRDVIASISISGLEARFTKENKEKWIKAILEISKEVTEHLSSLI